MKDHCITIIKRILTAGACMLVIFRLAGCGDDHDETTLQAKTNLLTASTWKIQEVNVDGVDQTALFQGLTVKFGATSFSSSNGEPIWPASDTWIFADSDGKTIHRGDGIDMAIETMDDKLLTLHLMWDKTTLGSGRVQSIMGSYTFRFVK